MTLKRPLANCPVSWGIEELGDPRNLSWETVLDEMAAGEYRSVELGPPGYLPSTVTDLRRALEERGMTLSAGYVMGHYAAHGVEAVDMASLRTTCELLAAFDGTTLLVMEDMYSERQATSSSDAERLTAAGWERLVEAVHAIAEIARGEFGVEVAFHPHVGTYVEYDDEIDRFFAQADSGLVGLCLDTGHSVWAGVDPLGVLERHGDRLRYLHLKDVEAAKLADARRSTFADAVDLEVFCPVGSGIVDFPGLCERLVALEFSGRAAIEQDRTPGLREGAVEDARASMHFLREIGLVSV